MFNELFFSIHNNIDCVFSLLYVGTVIFDQNDVSSTDYFEKLKQNKRLFSDGLPCLNPHLFRTALFPRMSPHVFFQTAFIKEFSSTNFTIKMFFTRMGPHVCLQTSTLTEAFLTNCTSKRFFTCTGNHVFLQVRITFEVWQK